MTRDDAKKILGEGATEEQISNLLNNYHVSESNKVKDLETQLNNLKAESSKYSDYDDIKKQLDEINKANMTEQEKLEEMKRETENNLKTSRKIVNTAKVKEILAGEQIDDDIINSLVDDNLETSIAKANKMKATLTNLKDNIAKQTRENLANVDLKPTIPNVNQNEGAMTIDKFMDLSAEEQEKFIAEHPTEYNNL